MVMFYDVNLVLFHGSDINLVALDFEFAVGFKIRQNVGDTVGLVGGEKTETVDFVSGLAVVPIEGTYHNGYDIDVPCLMTLKNAGIASNGHRGNSPSQDKRYVRPATEEEINKLLRGDWVEE